VLRLIQIPLSFPSGEHAVPSMGSLLHGVLMERIPRTLASKLHTEELRPFHQWLSYDAKTSQSSWTIGTIDDSLFDEFSSVVTTLSSVNIRQKNYAIGIGEPECIRETSFEELADQAFESGNVPSGVYCEFLTPTSFKHDGAYQIFPDTMRILQSLLCRWNAFSEQIRLDEPDLADRLVPYCTINRYWLRSAAFSVEHHRIVGFSGNVRFRFSGTDSAKSILSLLFSFAPFVGIGIKTALGMGAVHTEVWTGNRNNMERR